MRKLLACVGIVLVTSGGLSGCATGGAFQKKSKPQQAKDIMVSFQQSWDEACTKEWLRCDVTEYADTVVDAYVAAVDADPATWQSQADAAIAKIKARAMVSDLLGRWVNWLDVAQFAIDNIGKFVPAATKTAKVASLAARMGMGGAR